MSDDFYNEPPDDQYSLFDDLGDLITPDNAFAVADEYYPANKIGNAEWARDLAERTPYRPGQSERQHYNAALRNVERWRQGTRQPSAASLAIMASILRDKEGALLLALDMQEIDGWEVDVEGEVCVSDDCRPRSIHASLNNFDLAKIAAARAADQPDKVASTILQAYGIRAEDNDGEPIAMSISTDAEIAREIMHR